MKIGLILFVVGLALSFIFPPAGIFLAAVGFVWFAVVLVAKLVKIGVKTGARAVSATTSAIRSSTSPT